MDKTLFATTADKARLTQKEKDADDFQYYKDMADNLDRFSIGNNLIDRVMIHGSFI